MLLVKPFYVKFTSPKDNKSDFRRIEGDEVEMTGINPSLNNNEDSSYAHIEDKMVSAGIERDI